MKGKSKKSIIMLIVLLAIGFAAVTTTLTINGVIKIGANEKNFQEGVKFVNGAYLEYSDKDGHIESDHGSVTFEQDGRTLNFETGILKNLGEKVTLKYQIENDSQYYAQLNDLDCTLSKNGEGTTQETFKTNGTSNVRGDYVELIAESIDGIVLDPKSSESGEEPSANITNEHTVDISLIKSFVGGSENTTDSYKVSCTINANGLSDRPGEATTEKATRHTTAAGVPGA